MKITNKAGLTQVVRWEKGRAYWLRADAVGDHHVYVNDTDRTMEFMAIEFEKSR